MSADGPILVTGAYGLIGHSVTKMLSAHGVEVIPTDILADRPDDSDIEASVLDISGTDQIADFLADRGVCKIVHAAGVSGPAVAKGAPHLTFAANVGGTLDLFEAARLNGIDRIVLISSASVYGAAAGSSVTERQSLDAQDIYGSSKIGGELVARSYASEHGLEAVILRPSWVYGPRRRTPCVIRTMLTDAIAGQPTTIDYGKGWTRQFVWVEDVAEAVCGALVAHDVSGKAFNISDGVCTSFQDLAEKVRDLFEQARISIGSGPPPDDTLTGRLSIHAAADQLGWRPRTDIQTGLRQYAVGMQS